MSFLILVNCLIPRGELKKNVTIIQSKVIEGCADLLLGPHENLVP